jgi:hypothetical protein
MIKQRPHIMTVRENVHHIVDTLPDEHLEDVLDYLAELSEPDEPLSGETRAVIEEASATSATVAQSRWKSTGGRAVCEI